MAKDIIDKMFDKYSPVFYMFPENQDKVMEELAKKGYGLDDMELVFPDVPGAIYVSENTYILKKDRELNERLSKVMSYLDRRGTRETYGERAFDLMRSYDYLNQSAEGKKTTEFKVRYQCYIDVDNIYFKLALKKLEQLEDYKKYRS